MERKKLIKKCKNGEKTTEPILLSQSEKIKVALSEIVMDIASLYGDPSRKVIPSTAKDVYLLDRNTQEKIFLDRGYIKGKDKDYGLVRRAVGNRDLPVWQTGEDYIKREKVEPIANIDSHWYGHYKYELEDPFHYPTAVYVDSKGNLYQKAWDLNDYGNNSGTGRGTTYPGVKQIAANFLDKIGNPMVLTTGIQPMTDLDENLINLSDIPRVYVLDPHFKAIERNLNKKGLVFTQDETVGNYMMTLPEVIINSNGEYTDEYGLGLNGYYE